MSTPGLYHGFPKNQTIVPAIANIYINLYICAKKFIKAIKAAMRTPWGQNNNNCEEKNLCYISNI